jgi:hypothetical protein
VKTFQELNELPYGELLQAETVVKDAIAGQIEGRYALIGRILFYQDYLAKLQAANVSGEKL